MLTRKSRTQSERLSVRMSDNLLLDLTPREVEVIRMALRQAQDTHQRNDFKVLVIETEELRSKIANAIIDSHTSGKPARV
jgi:hypothetical protein